MCACVSGRNSSVKSGTAGTILNEVVSLFTVFQLRDNVQYKSRFNVYV